MIGMGELETTIAAPGADRTAIALAAMLCACAAVWTMALAVVDGEERRLPNELTLPAAAMAVAACFIAPAGWIGMIWPAAYLVAGRGIGGGDVKLAVPLGVALALLGGAGAVLTGILLASIFTVVFLVLTRRNTAAHGPSMLAAAWIVGFASTFLWQV